MFIRANNHNFSCAIQKQNKNVCVKKFHFFLKNKYNFSKLINTLLSCKICLAIFWFIFKDIVQHIITQPECFPEIFLIRTSQLGIHS